MFFDLMNTVKDHIKFKCVSYSIFIRLMEFMYCGKFVQPITVDITSKVLDAAVSLDIEPVLRPLRTSLNHAKQSIKNLVNEDITIEPGSPQEVQACKQSELNIELDFSSSIIDMDTV